MVEVVKITGENNLLRDLHSKAILNTDTNEVSKYNRQRSHMEKNILIANDVEKLKEDMESIKQLLNILISRS